MTPQAYLNALQRLDLRPASKATARVLGLTVRHIQKFKSGDSPIPPPVALLLRMYLRHGIPDDLLR